MPKSYRRRTRRPCPTFERLEPRLLLAGQPVLTEFLAINGEGLLDEDGETSDWIEIYNAGDEPINLRDWSLVDANDQWRFPSVVLDTGEFRVVFASGNDRRDPDQELHANFRLSGGGEYLALLDPDGLVVQEFSPAYPQQFGDVSYGLGQQSLTRTLLAAGADALAYIPTSADAAMGLDWVAKDYVPVGWEAGTTGVGYDYGGLVGLDVHEMRYNTASVYIRVPFEVDDPSGISTLTLRLRYEDGFVAFLNGEPIIEENSPDADELTWQSEADNNRDDNLAVVPRDFDITTYKGLLDVGENVLAFQGLNYGAGSSDLLVLPELIATETTSTTTVLCYFLGPTPRGPNGAGIGDLGPMIRNVTDDPPRPANDEDLVITAEVSETFDPVGSVTLHYRVMFGSEVTVAMTDGGTGDDPVAGDGIYTAIIPAGASGPGQMVRWYVSADDTEGVGSRNPLFLLPTNSPEYLGTVVADPSVQTDLPVLEYFTQNTSAEDTRTGTRAAVYYLGEFHDNVFIRQRGGYTTHGRKIEFNDGHHFRFDPDVPRVDEINLNEPGWDPTYLRQVLSWETYDNADSPGSTSFPMHIERNGMFYAVRIFIEQQDRDLLRREGLDPDGALYKMYNPVTSTGGAEKKTRRYEGYSDLQDLVNGISPSNPNRNTYLFDNINLAGAISYIAATTLTHDNDHVEKNYYLYRDTEGTGEWTYLPWDKDLTFGVNYGIGGVIASMDPYSHPLFGCSEYQKVDSKWNRLIDAIHDNPVTREMYLRRLRTIMDELLQPPGTPTEQLKFERRIDELYAALESTFGAGYADGDVAALKNQYLAVRRQHLYVTHGPGGTGLIPDALPESFPVLIGEIDVSPVSGNQDEEYIELVNPNAFAAEISGWRLTDAVEHTFPPGTVIPAGGSIYVTPNAKAFRARATGPRGGQQLFVQGNYAGHLSSFGETIRLLDADGREADSLTYAGDPSLAQQHLRITEIMYNPPAPTPAEMAAGFADKEQFEFIELKNVGAGTLNLNGVRFVRGVIFDFTGSAVTSLAAGGSVLVVSDAAAFQARYGTPAAPIAGEFDLDTRLDNRGENVEIQDATGSTILAFQYEDGWYDHTDGEGFSLTIRDAAGDRLLWDRKSGWRAGELPGGSPGADDHALNPGSIVISETLAHSNFAPNDWIELHNVSDQPINVSGWFLSDSDALPGDLTKYQIPATPDILPGGYAVFTQDGHFGSEFALSELGDDVYLSSNVGGQAGSYREHVDFGASEGGVTFGLHTNTTGETDFTLLAEATMGQPNAGPLFGALVVNEVMYHPADPPEGSGWRPKDLEFVELYNPSAGPIELDGSQLRGGVGFTFGWYDVVDPAGTADSAGQALWSLQADATATWSANLPVRGTYKVLVWCEADDGAGGIVDMDDSAQYEIVSGGRSRLAELDQDDAAGQWAGLGTFLLDAGPVTLTLRRGSGNPEDWTVADRVKFVRGAVEIELDEDDAGFTAAGSDVATLGAGEYLVLVKNPAAFEALYDAEARGITVAGQYSGSLSDGGDALKLERPTVREAGGYVPYVRVDHVQYDDEAPWPEHPDGGGPSLSRVSPHAYGNDPDNWTTGALGGTPGALNVTLDLTPPTVPTDVQATVVSASRVELTWTGSEDPETGVAFYRVYRNGVHIDTCHETSCADTGIAIGTPYTYRVSAVNGGGVESDWSAPSGEVAVVGIVSADAATDSTVRIVFTEPLDRTSAEQAENYVVDGATVLSASLAGGNVTVTLTTSPLVEGHAYPLVVSGVEAASGHFVPADLAASVTYYSWRGQDVGSVGAAGSHTIDGETWTLEGDGEDIWYQDDGFYYVYKSLHGDGEISARVVSVQYTDSWAKAGVMIRETLAGNSRHAMTVVTADSGIAFQRRIYTASSSSHTASSGSAPYWVRIAREGDVFSAYKSNNGTSWSFIRSETISMAEDVYLGLAVTSHNFGTLCTAVFDDVKVDEYFVPPPTVTGFQRNGGQDKPGHLISLGFTFSEDVSASLNVGDLVVHNDSTGQDLNLAGATVSYNGPTDTATWDLAAVTVPPGRYTLRLVASGIQNVGGADLDGNADGQPGGDWQQPTKVAMPGDTNLDDAVDVQDYLTVKRNFGLGPGAAWGDGDFDADGDVDVADYLAGKDYFGQSITGGAAVVLAPAEAPAPGGAAIDPDGAPAASEDGAPTAQGLLPAPTPAPTDAPSTDPLAAPAAWQVTSAASLPALQPETVASIIRPAGTPTDSPLTDDLPASAAAPDADLLDVLAAPALEVLHRP